MAPARPRPSQTALQTAPARCAEIGGGSRIAISALLRRLRHEPSELGHDPGALAVRASRLRLLALGDRHGELEGLLAFLAKELVARHGVHSIHSETRVRPLDHLVIRRIQRTSSFRRTGSSTLIATV